MAVGESNREMLALARQLATTSTEDSRRNIVEGTKTLYGIGSGRSSGFAANKRPLVPRAPSLRTAQRAASRESHKSTLPTAVRSNSAESERGIVRSPAKCLSRSPLRATKSPLKPASASSLNLSPQRFQNGPVIAVPDEMLGADALLVAAGSKRTRAAHDELSPSRPVGSPTPVTSHQTQILAPRVRPKQGQKLHRTQPLPLTVQRLQKPTIASANRVNKACSTPIWARPSKAPRNEDMVSVSNPLLGPESFQNAVTSTPVLFKAPATAVMAAPSNPKIKNTSPITPLTPNVKLRITDASPKLIIPFQKTLTGTALAAQTSTPVKPLIPHVSTPSLPEINDGDSTVILDWATPSNLRRLCADQDLHELRQLVGRMRSIDLVEIFGTR